MAVGAVYMAVLVFLFRHCGNPPFKDPSLCAAAHKVGMPIVILTAIAVICGAVAVKTFRWE